MMELTIHVHVTGLDKLAESIAAFASTQNLLAGIMQGQTAACNPAAPATVTATASTAAPVAPVMAPAAATTPNTAPAAALKPASAPVNPITSPVPLNSAPVAQTAAPTYTLDGIAQPAGAWLSADPAKFSERSAALTALNAEFGIEGIGQLAPEQYAAYALRLRALGVAI